MSVILSAGGGLCLAALSHVPSRGGSLSRGVSVSGGLCPGVSPPLCTVKSVWYVSYWIAFLFKMIFLSHLVEQKYVFSLEIF